MTSSKLISTRNICPSAVPFPLPTGVTSPQLSSFSQDSRATSRPQTRPGVAAAPETEADTFAEVRSRTYSAYAAGKESASGDMLCDWDPSFPGSNRAAKRVAATSNASGNDEGLDDVMDVEKGRGAGSGQSRDWEAKLFGVGTSGMGASGVDTLCSKSLMGISALLKNSFADLVWL